MMKQSKNKKGRLVKSTLSVVLAASMVMTSSSFVWASPVQEIQTETSPYEDIQSFSAEQVGIDEAIPSEWGTELAVPEIEEPTEPVKYVWTVDGTQGSETEETTAYVANKELIGKEVSCTATDSTVGTAKTATVKYTITARALTALDVKLKATYNYDGTAKIPAASDFEVKHATPSGSTTDALDPSNYAVAVAEDADNINAGSFSVVVTLTPEYLTEAGYTMESAYTANDVATIAPAETTFKLLNNDEKLSFSQSAPETFPFVVTDSLEEKNELTEADYDVKWDGDFTKVGSKVKATLTGKGNYTEASTGSFEFTIVADKTVGKVAAAEESYVFTPDSKGVQPEVKIFDVDNQEITGLEKNVDYKVTYTDNTKVGTATGTVAFPGTGKLAGTKTMKFVFEITPMPVNAATAQVEVPKNQEFTFDGTEKMPVVTSVKYPYVGSTATLIENVDYKVEVDREAINADTYTATIKAIGNYGTESNDTLWTGTFTIKESAFNSATVKSAPVSIAYGQTLKESDFKVTNIKTGVKVPDSEYVISKYILANGSEVTAAPSDMGSYKAILKYVGRNYKADDTLTVDYTIGGKTLDTAVVVIDYNSANDYYTYNPLVDGQAPTADKITVSIAGTPLKLADADGKNGDYKIEIPDAKDCKDAGVYTIKITGLNIYAGQTKEVTFEIKPQTIADGMIESVQAGTTHTGAAGAPYAVIKDQDGSYTLEAGKDYDMSVDTAKKTVSITGKGNYTTKKAIPKSYTVASTMNLDDPSIKAEVKGTYNWDKSAKEPSIDDIVLTEEYDGGSYTLVKDRDYDTVLTYKDNVNAGTAIVTVSAKEGTTRYTGTRDIEFEIVGLDITTDHKLDTTGLDKLSLSYTAEKKDHKDTIKQAVKVVNKTSLVALAKDTDYEVKLMQNGKEVNEAINPGTYTVSVEGTGNYTGKFTYDITIAGISLDSVANIPSKLDDQAYTGQEIAPEVAVIAKDSTVKLVKDVDYTISYLNNVEIGTGYAVVKGIGIYGGTVLVPFNIMGTDISKAAVTVDGTYSYTGKVIIPAVTVKVGETVIDSANYDVVATENVNAGTAKFTVVGKNNCTGTTEEATFTIAKADQKLAVSKATADALKIRNTNANTYTLKVTGAETKLSYKSSNTKVAAVSSAGKLSFKHVCGKATITVTAAADNNYNAATLKVAVVVKPATPKITVAARAKGFNAKATAVKDITGYQVGYSTDKNFAASKTTKKLVKTTKALNKNFSGLSAKKGYYVRVRAYKIASDGTVYWGNWTGAKKITTK